MFFFYSCYCFISTCLRKDNKLLVIYTIVGYACILPDVNWMYNLTLLDRKSSVIHIQHPWYKMKSAIRGQTSKCIGGRSGRDRMVVHEILPL